MKRLRLSFSNSNDGAGLRRAAHELLAGEHTPELIDDLLLIVTELVDNVVQHTAAGGELVLVSHLGTVTIEVLDTSRRMPRVRRPEPHQPGGRGLMLVAALSRAWGSRETPSGKVVWAQLA
ncbi:ATP-binding protein [Paractinoplanes hotanensis]|uniref:ATP-binding protein n=1 Tax=Paractinoplanes hotanensis TaxID=2906497 RepID=A0ABT0YDD3_9ACTN|nr:ATP-binding protein [Actinoplanes hotanensis]MCM4083805.1 ATP-binding protein [Actinoplanes hotanensis]